MRALDSAMGIKKGGERAVEEVQTIVGELEKLQIRCGDWGKERGTHRGLGRALGIRASKLNDQVREN